MSDLSTACCCTEGYGSHGAGFGLTFNTQFILEGLCAVAFLKKVGWVSNTLLDSQTELTSLEDPNYKKAVTVLVIAVFFAWLRFGYPKIQKRGSFP